MSSLVDKLLQPGTTPIAAISTLCETGCTAEERRAALTQALAQLDDRYDVVSSSLAQKKKEMQETKYKYESMAELADSMSVLRESLDETRRQVKQSETTLGTTGNVLELDEAKTRSNKLIQIITARVQYERAREALREEAEDPARRYAAIVDLQNAHETLQKHLSRPAVNSELEELKDQFLAWQSAALVFALQQGDYNKLLEIQKIYHSLGRSDEFVAIFRRVFATRLKDLDVSHVESIQALFSTLYREIEYILEHYLSVIRRFHSEEEAVKLIRDSVTEGLANVDLSNVLSSIICQAENSLELCSTIRKIFSDYKERLSKNDTHAKFVDIITTLKARSVDGMLVPFQSSFVNLILAKINSLELRGASHRQHVENLNTSIGETMQLLDAIVSQSNQLFGPDKAPQVYRLALERCIDNLTAKLRAWEYWTSSGGQARSVDDIFLVCSSLGHLVSSLNSFKAVVESDGFKLNTKVISKLNTQCCERTLKRAAETVVEKMASSIKAIKTEEMDDTHTRNLPLFSISPHEYMTNVGQDLLHLFHRFEQQFLDDNVLNSFHAALKKRLDADEILKSVIANVSEKVVNQFVDAVGDVRALKHHQAKQFLVDSSFLKDALYDLRCEDLEALAEIEGKLREFVDAKK